MKKFSALFFLFLLWLLLEWAPGGTFLMADNSDCSATVPDSGLTGQAIGFQGVPILAMYPPSKTSPSTNLAFNPSKTGYPSPLESDDGWGGGANKWEIVDGTRTYDEWYHGLAFTGGIPGWMAPCGWRQATINFGTPKTFNRVLIWHHAIMHFPKTYKIQYWSGSEWIDVFSTQDGLAYIKYPVDNSNWFESWGCPTENTFPSVTSSKVRFLVNNCNIEHGWIYNFEVYQDPPIDWDFGDGSPHVTGANVTHNYMVPGVYTWKMTVNNSGTVCQKTGIITIGTLSTLNIMSPNGGERWEVGTVHPITWSSSGFTGDVRIDYTTDNGATSWTAITYCTPNNGTYNWTIPDTVSTQCKIRVTSLTPESVSDDSNGTFSIYKEIPSPQRAALIALYNATNGDNWIHKNGWKTPPLHTDGFAMPGTESSWYGVSFSSATSVYQINLQNNNLSGTLPDVFVDLNGLHFLYLNGNNLSGSIPDSIGYQTTLEDIKLNNNLLTGSIPSTFNALSHVLYMDLSNNRLSGSLPVDLSGLVNCRCLILARNAFTGNIPAWLGTLTGLTYIDFSNNQFSGEIPSSIGNLYNLRDLYLNNNKLDGNLIPQICGLSNLRTLSFSYNKFTGPIPSEIGNLSNLNYLLLDNNELEGNIPGSLGNLSKLISLYLRSNKLEGSIPTSLTGLANLTAATDLGYNGLFTDNTDLITFLNGKDSDWQDTQTIAPSSVTVQSATSNSVAITWNSIPYKYGQGGYEVYYSAVSGGPYILFGTTEDKTVTSMTVTGLNPATMYYFVVKTKTNSHWNNANIVVSGNSAEVSAVTGLL